MMIPVHTTVELETLAHVTSYFIANGKRPKSKSEVLWFALETISQSVYGQGKHFTEQEALDFMAQNNLEIGIGNKRHKNKIKQISDVIIPNDDNKAIHSTEYVEWKTAYDMMILLGQKGPDFDEFKRNKEKMRLTKFIPEHNHLSTSAMSQEDIDTYADYKRDIESLGIIAVSIEDYVRNNVPKEHDLAILKLSKITS